MQRTTQGSFDANTHFQNEPHQFPHPPASSFGSSVTAASQAKRMTFYKSGDAQFKGVKMAIHKRSFKCFDALLDDLSQKVPLPFGVRTITTPRGTHSIKHLEQLEDGGCYLCSDRRYVKPINMEAAGKRPAVWHHHSHPHNPRRKPSRPEEPPSGHQHHHRQPKRIVLVKNNDPTVRRAIILSRRTARSLRVFMDEISELMQCHVKKLYTLEGRKIDNIQSLMQCPSVLVCVGREPFRPLLMESLKKLSDEKLPGMSTRSHSSVCSEGHESKKNEKSYQNGLCMTPGQSGCVSNCPYVKEVVVNDDIKKKVLVNKDGSLSVEMKVRFRLFNDETLQWSTEIKKSSVKVNDSGSVKDADYLKAKAEFSDPDSISASETEEAFATQLHQKHIEETLCQNCCNHCQEYDIWKNPMHKELGTCKSPSSSASSHKVVHKKSSVDSTRTISRSSGEYTEHVVEKASCFQQTMEEGDTRVEYCAISHCCNRGEVSSVGVTSKSKRSCEDDCESHTKTKYSHVEPKISPTPHCEVIKVMEERPVSAVSNSSKVLESLREDQDDDYDDLPPSISRASHWSQSDHLESDAQPKCVHCCGYKSSPTSYLSPRPPTESIMSAELKKSKSGSQLNENNIRVPSTLSLSSSRTADLLKEIVVNARPISRGSKSVASSKNINKVENKSQKSSRSKHSKVNISLECNNKELMPSCLPNASPTEVVKDWLRNIPIDGHVYEMDVELTEDMTLTLGGEDTSQRDKIESPESIIEVEKPHDDQAGENPIQQETNDICVETELCDKRAQLEVSTIDPNPKALMKQDSLQKQHHSSVQVMKVLLGPKLDRSSSLPEVSPVYGRKLSQSAQGLLDCLANLRLIDSDSKKEKQHKYNEVMMILQSLWLQKPSEDEQKSLNTKEHPSIEDEFNPRSSSGVDVSSSSTGSVKGSMNGILEKIETVPGTIPPIAEQVGSLQDKDEEDQVKSTAQACEYLDPPKVPSDPVTPGIAERVQGSPVNTQLDDDQENCVLQEDDVESSENKNESDLTPQTTSCKSSGNESNTMKSQENTSSGTPPSVQRAPLTKRVSQDPDPIWVLSLLKKLEKQFMLHYADAMTEFKVRWDLDDNEMLDKMITELKEEVHKRIQSSINRELQKIQSRAGRGPRPPGNTLSRDSTVQTEQRRKRLRVMRNKSILSRSDENYTASGTEYSDQRSDDEYCPCDACMKKKMASRAAQRAQALSLAPVMMEFDLRKILQMKKDPAQPTEPKTEEQHSTNLTFAVEKEEVFHEEVEEANDDTKDHKFEVADQEPDGVDNTVDEGRNAENIKDVDSVNSEIRDPNEKEANDKRDSGEEHVENEEGEDVKEEMVVNGKTDAEEKEEVEIVEDETKKDTEEDCEKKDSPNGDAASAENSDTAVEAEKEDEMRETGEEIESDDREAETETGKESTEVKPADDGGESNSNKDDTPIEGETSDETSNIEKNAEWNQDGSAKIDVNEGGTSDTGQDKDQPENSKEVKGDTENEMNKCSSVEEDFEKEESDKTVVDDCESTLAKQVTRTSVESQPGSMENCMKLKDLQSFMESVESQGDSVVVITKQPPYKEPHGNKKDMRNGLTEWQVSPKINNRASKQKKGQ
ncbi:hypothetical protein cypCar_00035837 [Cyprinus carpio]|nr:hypothetical protein cypCar_00035837 [Cyprinus carpio]